MIYYLIYLLGIVYSEGRGGGNKQLPPLKAILGLEVGLRYNTNVNRVRFG